MTALWVVLAVILGLAGGTVDLEPVGRDGTALPVARIALLVDP